MTAVATGDRRVLAGMALVALGIGIGIAVMPFAAGLLGAPILAVVFAPFHERLRHHAGPGIAAAATVALALVAVFLPVIGLTLVLISELPEVLSSPAIERALGALTTLRIGPFDVGDELAAVSADGVAWLSRATIGMVGGLTLVVINMMIAFVGLYFLIRSGEGAWRAARALLPVGDATATHMRERFRDLTRATILGIGVTAIVQGAIIGAAFMLVGLGHPLLWAAATGVVSVLPLFGTALVWVPGTALLVIEGRVVEAVILGLIGVVIASNIDNVIRPIIFRRVSGVHPLITIVGAFAGMRYFGLLGVLLGPLALVYFIELVQVYQREARSGNDGGATSSATPAREFALHRQPVSAPTLT